MQAEELRAARTETETSLARYTELFDFAPIGYLALFTSETISELNHAAARLLGRHRSHLAGQSFGALLQPDDHRALSALIGKALATESHQSCEVSLKKVGSPPLRLRLTAAPLARSEPKVLLALEDVTELRESQRRKDEFLAVLSHELRNPLAPLRNSLYVLTRANPEDPQTRRAQDVMDRQLSHLTRLVDDLLDVTRITRGKIRLRRTRVDVWDLARRVMDDHRQSFEASGLSLEGHFDAGPFWVDGDPDRLIQVLVNLLNNAEKFTPRGGTVTLRLAREDGRVKFSVRDTGIGIAPELLSQLFEPFAQAPQSLDRTRGGLGLGLTMVKALVELHGGTVGIASAGRDSGTEVTFSLPLRPAPAAAAHHAPRRPTRLRRVLIIEDRRDAADSLRDALAIAGHDVEVAYDGTTGIERAREFRPEVVLCDIGLPGVSGYEVARAFRSEPALRDAYLVALTGYAMPDDVDRAVSVGFDQHITKPPALEKLEELLASAPEMPDAETPAEPH
jgi:two-component system CheB/CheR fusion protein